MKNTHIDQSNLPPFSFQDQYALEKSDSLLRVFEDIHNHIYANDGLSPEQALEETIKILFIKIFDEKNNKLEFTINANEYANVIDNGKDLGFSKRFEALQKSTYASFSDIFEKETKINLKPSTLAYSVNKLQNIDLSNSEINLTPSSVQTKLYNKYSKSTISNGVSAYLTTGSTKHFAVGLYTRGTRTLSFDQKMFEYNIENKIDNLNVAEIFAKNNLTMDNTSLLIAKGVYETQVLDTLVQNKVILPYTGTSVPFTVLPTNASKGLKDAEKRA